MNKLVPTVKQKEFIMRQLENHTQKIVKFSEIFGDSDYRKKVKVQTMQAESTPVSPAHNL